MAQVNAPRGINQDVNQAGVDQAALNSQQSALNSAYDQNVLMQTASKIQALNAQTSLAQSEANAYKSMQDKIQL